jgi:imidazolonepropionase-like amidohydrolase
MHRRFFTHELKGVRGWLCLVLGGFGGCQHAQVVAPQTSRLAITNVHIVNVREGRIDSNRTILISGDVVSDVMSADRVPPGFAVVTRLAGSYVIPGMWDMHTHLGRIGRHTLGLYVANGITGVRDMGGSFDAVRAWADSVRAGALLGPDILVASPIVERAGWLAAVRRYAVGNHDTTLARELDERIGFSTGEDAIRAVDTIVSLHADFVKIRNDASREATLALLRHARERGLRVAGHWPERLGPIEASDSGYSSFEHGPLTIRQGALTPTLDTFSPEQRSIFFATMRRNGTAYTPTVVAIKGFRLTPDSALERILADSLGTSDDRMRYVRRGLLRSWKSDYATKVAETRPDDWASFQRSFLRDIRPMVDAGVVVLAGTDAGSPLVLPAFSLSEELEALVTDGRLTALQSLRAATLNVGEWLGMPNTIGVVTSGARADLVFLTKNPLNDIRNVRDIRAVLRGGRLLDRAALDTILARSARAAR